MYVPSLCKTAVGPTYPYFSASHYTTTSLPQMTVHLFFFECKTIDKNPLNTSNHLSLPYNISCIHQPQFSPSEPKINWITNGSVNAYSAAVNTLLGHVLDSPLCEQLGDKVKQVSDSITITFILQKMYSQGKRSITLSSQQNCFPTVKAGWQVLI